MTPSTLVAGSIAADAGLAIARPPEASVLLHLHYRAEAVGITYPVRIESARLSVIVRASEQGWIARAHSLNALGYGTSQRAALDDLYDSVEQYLEFLRDDAPFLAPAVAHHAAYVQLLDAPRAVWFASVDAPTVE